MKKAYIVLAFVAALFITEKAQAQLNLYAGYTPEIMNTKAPSYDTTLFFHGFNFGVSWNFSLYKNLCLTAGAQYRMNLRDSAKHYWAGSIFIHDLTKERQMSIDIPFLLKYSIPAGETVTFSPFVGPMLSWGINGKTSETTTFPLNHESQREWYGENGYMNRFNVYAMAGIEMDIKHFFVSLGGRYGFLNLYKLNATTTTKSYGFFINFGHTF